MSCLLTAAHVIPALTGENSWGLPDAEAIGFDGADLLEVAMPIPLSPAYDAARLRRRRRESEDAGQTRRLLALAAIYDGASRTEAAAIGGVTLQMVRDWVLRFNARGPDGLIDRKAPGQAASAERCASRGAGGGDRERPDPGDARRGALADGRSLPVGMGRVRRSACPSRR